jgi:hypothetical protein
VIREFTPAEDAEVQALQRDCAVGAWLIPVGYRAGLQAGVRRALTEVERASGQAVAIARLRGLLAGD